MKQAGVRQYAEGLGSALPRVSPLLAFWLAVLVASFVFTNRADDWAEALGQDWLMEIPPVSYTHLTLPTIYSV